MSDTGWLPRQYIATTNEQCSTDRSAISNKILEVVITFETIRSDKSAGETDMKHHA